jgi:hypothetical protein
MCLLPYRVRFSYFFVVLEKMSLNGLYLNHLIIIKILFTLIKLDWIELAQDRDRWRTLLSAVMSLQVP